MRQKLVNSLPQGIEDIQLAIFDIDGTIAGPDSQVSDFTIRALRKLVDAGISVMFASGRHPAAAISIFDRMGCSGYSVGCNGALVIHSESSTPISVSPLHDQTVNQALAYSHQVGLEVTFFTPHGLYTDTDGNSRPFLAEVNNGDTPQIIDFAELKPNDRLKLTLFSQSGGVEFDREIQQELPTAVKALDNYFELTSPGVSKWTGIKTVLSAVDISPEHVLGIGDSENDLSWLPKIGISIAMGNAFRNVKSSCSYEIGSHREDSAGHFVNLWASHLLGTFPIT